MQPAEKIEVVDPVETHLANLTVVSDEEWAQILRFSRIQNNTALHMFLDECRQSGEVVRGNLQAEYERRGFTSDIVLRILTNLYGNEVRFKVANFLLEKRIKVDVELACKGAKHADRFKVSSKFVKVTDSIPSGVIYIHGTAKEIADDNFPSRESIILTTLIGQYLGVSIDVLSHHFGVTNDGIIKIVDEVNRKTLDHFGLEIYPRNGSLILGAKRKHLPSITVVDTPESRVAWANQESMMEELDAKVLADTNAGLKGWMQAAEVLSEEDVIREKIEPVISIVPHLKQEDEQEQELAGEEIEADVDFEEESDNNLLAELGLLATTAKAEDQDEAELFGFDPLFDPDYDWTEAPSSEEVEPEQDLVEIDPTIGGSIFALDRMDDGVRLLSSFTSIAKTQREFRCQDEFAAFERYNQLKEAVLERIFSHEEGRLAIAYLLLPVKITDPIFVDGNSFGQRGWQYFTSAVTGELNNVFDQPLSKARMFSALTQHLDECDKGQIKENLELPFGLHPHRLCDCVIHLVVNGGDVKLAKDLFAQLNLGYPMLQAIASYCPEEDHELRQLIAANGEIHTRLYKNFLRQVAFIARPFVMKGASARQCLQLGSSGLARSIDTYAYLTGKPFFRYCNDFIWQSINRGLEVNRKKDDSMSRKDRETLKLIRKEIPVVYAQCGELNLDRLARRTGIPVDEVTRLLELKRMRAREVSMNQPLGEDSDRCLADTKATANTETPEDVAMRTLIGALSLEDVIRISDLTKQEEMVIRKRFIDELTLEQVGEILGRTRERARQIETKAKNKMKEVLVILQQA